MQDWKGCKGDEKPPLPVRRSTAGSTGQAPRCRYTVSRFVADTAVVLTDCANPILAYAADALCGFLRKTTSMDIRQQEAESHSRCWLFRLAIDPSFRPTEFGVTCDQPLGSRLTVKLLGHDATGVLHAVYSLLERAGICFDITGPLLPAQLALDRLPGWSCQVRPDVQWRGTRLYLNFSMDISSYLLGEAKEYLRNVARLRMNLIEFHSYQGIFYECPALKLAAGNFFYGQRHDLPEKLLLRNSVRNRRTFCVPEIEALYDRPQERSQAAVQWLAELMCQAKTCGLTVQFSFEPPGMTAKDGLAASLVILGSYPQIQTLEMITSENGGHPEKTLARYLEIADLLKQRLRSSCPKLAVGIYEAGPGLKEGLAFLRQNCPPDVAWTFLPAHGARAVVDAVRSAELTAEDWRRTMMHSWVEFDGLMYLQQNSLLGTRQLLDLARSALTNSQVPAIAFYHWRTAENRTAIRYAALACLDARLNPQSFYIDYATALGIGGAGDYARAMSDLDEVDAFCRDHLFNIGFCFLGCWTGPQGLAWTRGWKKENLEVSRQRLVSIEQALAGCLRKTDTLEGRRYLRFLDNRLRGSVIHLQLIGHLLELHGTCDDAHPESLNPQGRKLVEEQCRSAMQLAESYMQLHAEAIMDRGCEGTLISYYHTIPPYLNHLRDLFLKNALKEEKKSANPSGPPAPGESSKP
jgi:hypothetical protein